MPSTDKGYLAALLAQRGGRQEQTAILSGGVSVASGGVAKSVAASVDVYDAAYTPVPNGTVTDFTMPSNYVPGTVRVLLNGDRLKRGAAVDFTEVAPNLVRFVAAPIASDILIFDYSPA